MGYIGWMEKTLGYILGLGYSSKKEGYLVNLKIYVYLLPHIYRVWNEGRNWRESNSWLSS